MVMFCAIVLRYIGVNLSNSIDFSGLSLGLLRIESDSMLVGGGESDKNINNSR